MSKAATSTLNLGGESSTDIVNGDRGQVTRGGRTLKIPYHALLNHDLKLIPLLSEMSDFANPRYDLRYVGSEVFNGQRVPHIRMRRQFYSSRIELATTLR